MKYKLNYYTIFIPFKVENIVLVYNSLNNSLHEIEYLKGNRLMKIKDSDVLETKDLKYLNGDFEELLKNKIFLNAEDDERNSFVKFANSKKQNLLKNNGIISLTICTTNLCNLNCSYCYEGDKKGSHMTDKTGNDIVKFIENQILTQSFKNEINTVSITWFGGEPTLNIGLIVNMSEKLIVLCKNNNVKYRANIITNGTNLTNDFLSKLSENGIDEMQISIDGSKNTHDRKRPFLNGKGTFNTIITNIKKVPRSIFINVRIHADKEVVKNFVLFFTLLSKEKIWPHRAENVNLHLVNKDYYPFTRENKELYLSDKEFFKIKEEFRKLKVEYYNKWAILNKKPLSKLKIEYPIEPVYFCGPASDPLNITVNEKGYIHKCWDDVNDKSTRIQYIDQFDITSKKYDKWLSYSKSDDLECFKCKFLPICEIYCPKQHFDNRKKCTEWKYLIKNRLKEYYLNYFKKMPNSIHSAEINKLI